MDTIAFSATLDHYLNVSAGASVLYNKVLLDTGDGYDPTQGIFTVPSSGVYLFHVFR